MTCHPTAALVSLRSAVCALLLLPLALSSAAAESPSHSALLKPLPKSKLLLQAPGDLSGDFAVAGTIPQVEVAFFPNQWEGARLWSSWGDGLRASDGNYYLSIGDHDAPHGTAYVYRVDPRKGTVELVVDFNTVLKVANKEHYTPGKIHGAIVDGQDGWIYFAGYRGSVRKTGPESAYEGDHFLRYNLESGEIEDLGILVPHCSVPVLRFHAPSRSLYGLAAPGKTAPKQTDRFFRYSLEEKKLLFVGGPEPQPARAMVLADDGRAWYSHKVAEQGMLMRYSPPRNKIVPTKTQVPGNGALRAASRPDQSGVAYCITHDGVVFSFDSQKEKISKLGEAFVGGPLYTAACRLDPTGRYLYYVPGAHGRSSRSGTPVLQFDVKKKRVKVIAFLNELVRKEMNHNLGGTYGLALSEDGSELCINFNGAPLGSKQTEFGKCSVVLVHIPAEERK